MDTIALFGAAGKIGTRIASRLKEATQYRSFYVEAGEEGQARLRANNFPPTSEEIAVREADTVIFAVPDKVLGKVAHHIVPQLRAGTLVIGLDPAAPHGGELPPRRDIAYFIVHPCHPPVINDEVDLAAKMDFYGGIKAKQNIVCALMQGSDRDYERGEAVARAMFAPVMRAHRISVEQMAILEPAMAETVVLTCMFIMKEAMEEAVNHGVPEQAALDFIMGHINVNLGIQYGYLDTKFSDAAYQMVERAKRQIINPEWKKVFDPENVKEQVRAITQSR